jgi:Ca2+-binding EF-hand superfamily protein
LPGFDVKKPEVLGLMREYDREQSGRIEFGDFYEISIKQDILS